MPPIKADYLPESYNALRKELHDNHPALWKKVQWFLAFDWPLFIEHMNNLLAMQVPFQLSVDEVCTIYLTVLKNKSGIIIH